MMNYATLGRSLGVLLATATPTLAQAQQLNMPRTVRVTNNATGELIATITVSGNSSYVRDKNGELVGTVVSNPDGSKTSFDPSGNVIAPIKLPE